MAVAAAAPLLSPHSDAQTALQATVTSWPLNTPRATGIHDLAPAPDGGVWWLPPESGTEHISVIKTG